MNLVNLHEFNEFRSKKQYQTEHRVNLEMMGPQFIFTRVLGHPEFTCPQQPKVSLIDLEESEAWFEKYQLEEKQYAARVGRGMPVIKPKRLFVDKLPDSENRILI